MWDSILSHSIKRFKSFSLSVFQTRFSIFFCIQTWYILTLSVLSLGCFVKASKFKNSGQFSNTLTKLWNYPMFTSCFCKVCLLFFLGQKKKIKTPGKVNIAQWCKWPYYKFSTSDLCLEEKDKKRNSPIMLFCICWNMLTNISQSVFWRIFVTVTKKMNP